MGLVTAIVLASAATAVTTGVAASQQGKQGKQKNIGQHDSKKADLKDERGRLGRSALVSGESSGVLSNSKSSGRGTLLGN